MKRAVLVALVGAVAVAGAAYWEFSREDFSRSGAPTGSDLTSLRPSNPAQAPVDTPTAGQPSFDVVRINPKGDALIAGRAPAGSEVEILDGTDVLGKATADTRGEWVYVPGDPLPPGSLELTLRARLPDGATAESKSVVVLVVPEREADIAGRPAATGSQPLALKVPKDPGASTLLQSPTAPAEGALISIDAVDTDGKGHVAMSGRAEAAADLQVYIDNGFLGRVRADDKGVWKMKANMPSQTANGKPSDKTHILRVDRITAGGKVMARVEQPFSPYNPVDALPHDTVVVVKPGVSLWHLARKTYGSGYDYTIIFEANRDQIKDPEKIYPGQVFTLPPPPN